MVTEFTCDGKHFSPEESHRQTTRDERNLMSLCWTSWLLFWFSEVICRDVLANPQPLSLFFCSPQQTSWLNREEQVRRTFISYDFCSLPFCFLGLWSPNPFPWCFKWFVVMHRSDLLNLSTCVLLAELKWDDKKFCHLSSHTANGPCLSSSSCSCIVCVVICCLKWLLGVVLSRAQEFRKAAVHLKINILDKVS